MDWCNCLYRRAFRVVEEGVQSEEHYKVVLKELEEGLLNKFSLVQDEIVH